MANLGLAEETQVIPELQSRLDRVWTTLVIESPREGSVVSGYFGDFNDDGETVAKMRPCNRVTLDVFRGFR